MNKEFITWEQVQIYINKLIEDLKIKGIRPTGVYGIPRGGLILATLLSYKLNIPLLLAPSEGCVIIDDIADSGRTLCHYTNNDTQFNSYYITTMFYHNRSIVTPDFYALKKHDEWIVFPWEHQLT